MTVFGAAMYSYLALVLLQRVFDQPLVGLIALAIIFSHRAGQHPDHTLAHSAVYRGLDCPAGRRARHWIRASGLVRTVVPASFRDPPEPLRAMTLALPYLSVIAPIAIYQVLQDIASVAGAAAAGDDYDIRAVLACDGLGTLVCGLAGSVIAP